MELLAIIVDCLLFLRKKKQTKSSQMFYRILNTPLIMIVNPFSTNILLLYSKSKTSANLRFSDVFVEGVVVKH